MIGLPQRIGCFVPAFNTWCALVCRCFPRPMAHSTNYEFHGDCGRQRSGRRESVVSALVLDDLFGAVIGLSTGVVSATELDLDGRSGLAGGGSVGGCVDTTAAGSYDSRRV